MQQLKLPFEEDLETKAKKLFKKLEENRIGRLRRGQRKWWLLKWQNFHTLLLAGYDIRVYEISDDALSWDTYKRRD